MEAIFTKLFLGVHFMAIYTSGSSYTNNVQLYFHGISWFNASEHCGKNGLEHDLTILSHMDALKNNTFWIGIIKYEEMTPWMERVGCYRFDPEQRIQATSVHESVGLCQRQCQKYLYFSYQKNTKECCCFPLAKFKELHKLNVSNCTKKNNMWVYKRFYYNESDKGIEKCMVSTCSENDVQLTPMDCNAKSSSIQALCDDFKHIENQYYAVDFWNAQQGCYMRNKNLMSPYNCSKPAGVKAWTSAFRDNITIELFNEKASKQPPLGCLVGKRRNDAVPIRIDINLGSCDHKYEYFVCKSTLYENSTNLDLGKDNKSKNQDNLSYVGSVTGVVIGGVFAIGFGISLVVWKIRRRKNQTARQNETHQECDTVKHVTNQQYGLDEEQNKSTAENAVVKKGDKHERKPMPTYAIVHKENLSNLSSPEDNYSLASEEEYDRLNNALSRIRKPKENVYGIAGQYGEDEYNTLNNMASNVKHAENLYDLNKPSCKGNEDQTYDTSINSQHKHNGSDTIYDHSV